MKILFFWTIVLCALQISGCSDTDRPTNHASGQKANNSNILMASEKPSLSIVDVDDDHYILLVSDKGKGRMEFHLEKSGGVLPEIVNSFFSNYCGKKVLIIVLEGEVNTGVSYGSDYANVVIDIASGKILDEIHAGEVSDKETNEVISNNQKEAILKLKSGVQSADECQKIDGK